MPIKKFKAMTPGTRFRSVTHDRGDHASGPGEIADGADSQEGRPQPPRAHHDAPAGRRPQAALSEGRFQAREARRARAGRGDRVRSEPYGAYRADPVRGWREALHSAPARAEPGRRRSCPARGSDPRVGNSLPLGEIPLGSAVHAVELKPGKGAQAVRSAGVGAQVMAKEGDLRHAADAVDGSADGPSRVRGDAWARWGTPDHELQVVGQGRARPGGRADVRRFGVWP